MNKQDFNEGLLGFLDASPTPFHAYFENLLPSPQQISQRLEILLDDGKNNE